MHKTVSWKLYVTKAIQDTDNKKQLLIVLQFLGGQSFLVRKWLQSCIKNHLPYGSLKISFQSKNRLSSLFRYIISKEMSSHLVYKYTCSCCNTTYYGESERNFFVRAFKHLGMTHLTGKRVKNLKKISYLWPNFAEGSWRQFWRLYNSLERKQQI